MTDVELLALARRCAETAVLHDIARIHTTKPDTAARRKARAAIIRSGEITIEVRAAINMGEALRTRANRTEHD